MTELLIFVAGCIAGFANVLAGGGSALSLATLIFFGFDAATANGTNRIALLAESAAATGGFHKNKLTDYPTSFKLGLCTVPGALIGAWLAIEISQQWFEYALAAVNIFILATLFLPNLRPHNGNQRTLGLYAAMFLVGIYGGFIQAGVGFLIIIAMYLTTQLTLSWINVHKVWIVLIYTLPVIIVFGIAGAIDWYTAIFLAAGNAIGAWVAAHWNSKVNDKWIKSLLALILVLSTLKLVA